MSEPPEILETIYRRATTNIARSFLDDNEMSQQVEYIARNLKNRAGVRLLMSCLLAKIHKPELDVRKPYTEIGSSDAFSGRTYDEQYITPFINKYNLPCNNTTAFLTPALRNRNNTLTKDFNLVGRPPQLYRAILNLLDDVYNDRVLPFDLLTETVRWLIILRNERQQRLESLIRGLNTAKDETMLLSCEDIVNLIEKHLSLKGTSRLPVLIVAAAYKVAEKYLKERILSLHSHNAADLQTGALGDVEITLIDNDEVVTCYEIKNKSVTNNDIDIALQKLSLTNKKIDNYIFITTEKINSQVQEYARSLYLNTGGIEFTILDCISFTRHFIHLFYRLRNNFLEVYQELILSEPESSVSQPVKEAFLAMRQAVEVGMEDS